MFIHIKTPWFEFFASTKRRYYDFRADNLVENKPGVRLFIPKMRWVFSNRGFRNLRNVTKVG